MAKQNKTTGAVHRLPADLAEAIASASNQKAPVSRWASIRCAKECVGPVVGPAVPIGEQMREPFTGD